MRTKRAYRIKIRIGSKNIIATVDSINMIRLVAACEKNNRDYKVIKCLGRL